MSKEPEYSALEGLKPERAEALFEETVGRALEQLEEAKDFFYSIDRPDLVSSFERYLSNQGDKRVILHLNPGYGANTAAVSRAFSLNQEVDKASQMIEIDENFYVCMHLIAHFPEHTKYQLAAGDFFQAFQDEPSELHINRGVGFRLSAKEVIATLEALKDDHTMVCDTDFLAFFTTYQLTPSFSLELAQNGELSEEEKAENYQEVCNWLSEYGQEEDTASNQEREWVIECPKQKKRIIITVFPLSSSRFTDNFGYYIRCEPTT